MVADGHQHAPPTFFLSSRPQQAFSSAGLLLPAEKRPVKLHATLINTRYRSRSSDGGGGGRQQGAAAASARVPFDGRELLKRHADIDLGLHTVTTLHLSQRGKYDESSGYYQSAATLELGSGGGK